MLPAECFSLPPGLSLTDVFLSPELIVLAVAPTTGTADCPACGQPSDRVHSRYRRTVADLASNGRRVVLRVSARKFFCRQPDCPRSVFCERLPRLAAPQARSSDRLADVHRALGFALGGEAGARLAAALAMPTSSDTLLRRVKAAAGAPLSPPRVVGVDDWALRKGQTYGTLLVDLERGRVIDLFPGRDGAALQAWLRAHPGVEVVARDRWTAYAQAAAAGAPQATQVADRWHLLKNLREMVERLFGRMSAAIKKALTPAPAEGAPPTGVVPPTAEGTVAEPGVPDPTSPAPAEGTATAREQSREARKARRRERYERVRELRRQGWPVGQIARQLRMSKVTVLRYLRCDRCPDWWPGQPRPTGLDRYREFLERRIAEGCRTAQALHQELAERGYRGSYCSVWRFLTQRLGGVARPRRRSAVPVAPPAVPSPRRLSFDFLRRAENRTAEQADRLRQIRTAAAGLAEALDLAEAFAALVRKQAAPPLPAWLAQAERCATAEVREFAKGLRQDEAAVAAAMTHPWSSGPVEGQVNRLKLIKRQMYGRAGFALLRARVLRAA